MKPKPKPIVYGRHALQEEDIQAVVETLRSDFLTQGPRVELFETEIGKFLGASSVAVNNGTAALHLAALGLGVKPGDHVLVASNTFVASANCVRYCGADVEFVDSDPRTHCLDLQRVREMIRKHPKGYYCGIIAVDFAGYVVDYAQLRQIANEAGLWIIEDACHAIGGEHQTPDGQWHRAGSGEFADAAVFSFHPVKHLATGEGGLVSTRNPELFEKMRQLRTHGIVRDPKRMRNPDAHGPWFYEMQSLGYNYRIPDILCALGITQLRRLEANLKARRSIAERYRRELKDLPLQMPWVANEVRHAYHLFVTLTEQRDELYHFLKAQEISCQVHYIPVHTQPYYRELYGRVDLPQVEAYYRQALSLPMYHSMSFDDQTRVIEALKEFFECRLRKTS